MKYVRAECCRWRVSLQCWHPTELEGFKVCCIRVDSIWEQLLWNQEKKKLWAMSSNLKNASHSIRGIPSKQSVDADLRARGRWLREMVSWKCDSLNWLSSLICQDLKMWLELQFPLAGKIIECLTYLKCCVIGMVGHVLERSNVTEPFRDDENLKLIWGVLSL